MQSDKEKLKKDFKKRLYTLAVRPEVILHFCGLTFDLERFCV